MISFIKSDADNPYPTEQEKTAFAIETGLTMEQICNWYSFAENLNLEAGL